MSVGKEYLKTVIKRFRYYKGLAEATFIQLEEKDFHFQPSSDSNSISIIIQHMAGNMLSRFTNFLTEDGEKEWRQRDAEFENQDFSKQQLIDIWDKGWHCSLSAIEALQKKDLLKSISIRKEPLTVVDAINRQLAHYPYHVGQIVFYAKQLKNSEWESLSIPRNKSDAYNTDKFAQEKRIKNFTDEELKRLK